jgi:hypothetical protein
MQYSTKIHILYLLLPTILIRMDAFLFYFKESPQNSFTSKPRASLFFIYISKRNLEHVIVSFAMPHYYALGKCVTDIDQMLIVHFTEVFSVPLI